MNELIYEIPIVDAFKEEGECPFCNMIKKIEKDSLDYMLDTAYMEDDVRLETDKKGFCKFHFEKMFYEKNRLGLALMAHTHVKKINKDLEKKLSDIIDSDPQKTSLFKKKTPKASELIEYIEGINESCYLCDKSAHTFDRYLDNFLHLFKKQHEVVDLLSNSKGLCLTHLAQVLKTAEKKLNSTDYDKLAKMLAKLQKENMLRLEEEIDWFIDKFDYRYKDEPWKNSKDSLPRLLQKLAGL